MTDRELATKIAWSMLWQPYLWGGDDPMAGFDCSGAVIEILKSVGILPRKGDWRARDLYRKFRPVDCAGEGVLVFVEKGGVIVHVEYCLDGKRSIGAGGGDSRIINIAAAIKYNAYIKIRPFRSLGAVLKFADPFTS